MAILGAHNLGGASSFKSGFDGNWKHLPDEVFILNSDFYKIMLDPSVKWKNVDAALKANFSGQGHKWQWEGLADGDLQPHMFFNTDFYVFFNITLDANGKATCILDTQCGLYGTCGLNGTCAKSQTYDFGLQYSKVNNTCLRAININCGLFRTWTCFCTILLKSGPNYGKLVIQPMNSSPLQIRNADLFKFNYIR